jgi:hypothetical protein
MGDLNLRDLGAVLDALMADGRKEAKLFLKMSLNGIPETVYAPEKLALYDSAIHLLKQTPANHPLRKRLTLGEVEYHRKLLTDQEERFHARRAAEHMRGYTITVAQECCAERIAKELGDFFAQKHIEIPMDADDSGIKKAEGWSEMRIRGFQLEEVTDDDGKVGHRVSRAYVGLYAPEFREYSQVHLFVNPPYTVAGLNELLEKHNFGPKALTDEIYEDYGIAKNHPHYERVKRGAIPVQDNVQRCACPPKRQLLTNGPAKEDTDFAKKYELTDESVSRMQDMSNVFVKSHKDKGWKGMDWKVVLPAPLANYFVHHAKHTIDDVMGELGHPEQVEWSAFSIAGGEAALAIVSCAYNQERYKSTLHLPNAPQIGSVIEQVINGIDITDRDGLMQIRAYKEPGKRWARKSASGLLLP